MYIRYILDNGQCDQHLTHQTVVFCKLCAPFVTVWAFHAEVYHLLLLCVLTCLTMWCVCVCVCMCARMCTHACVREREREIIHCILVMFVC